MSETLDAPAVIEDMPQPPADAGEARSIRETMADVLAKYPDRGADGRFAAREVPSAGEETTQTTDQPEAQATEPEPPAIEAPASWSADKKATWATLPRDVQEYVAQREADAHKAISEKGSRAAAYDAVEAAIGEHRAQLVAEYGSIDRAIGSLANIAIEAGRRPADFVRWFAQQHGVDLSTLTQPAGTPAAPVDPHIARLSQTVDTLHTHIRQQDDARLASVIAEFSEAKDASGKPLRPHFDAVRGAMAKLMQSGIAASLDDAYDMATRMDKAVWAQIEADKEAAREAAAQAKAAKAAAEARKAASVNVKPVGAVAGSPVAGATMRDTMAAVFAERMGRA